MAVRRCHARADRRDPRCRHRRRRCHPAHARLTYTAPSRPPFNHGLASSSERGCSNPGVPRRALSHVLSWWCHVVCETWWTINMVPCCIWVIVGPFTEVSGSRNFPAPTEHPVHLPGGAQDDDSIPPGDPPVCRDPERTAAPAVADLALGFRDRVRPPPPVSFVTAGALNETSMVCHVAYETWWTGADPTWCHVVYSTWW